MSISYYKSGLVSSHQTVGRWFIFMCFAAVPEQGGQWGPGPRAAPSGGRHFVDKNKILKGVFNISDNSLLLLNKVLNGYLFNYCV